MANRFGRNQRRKLRDELANRERLAIERERIHLDEINGWHRRLDQAKADIAAARSAKDTVRITVDAILDPRENALQMRARFEGYQREPLYSAFVVNERDIIGRSDTERHAFIEYAGKLIAEHGLAQIVRHWRSR